MYSNKLDRDIYIEGKKLVETFCCLCCNFSNVFHHIPDIYSNTRRSDNSMHYFLSVGEHRSIDFHGFADASC